jgi:energy-coupling factor transporter ATP-binding protein EcfA2
MPSVTGLPRVSRGQRRLDGLNPQTGLPGDETSPCHNHDVFAVTEQRVTADALSRLAATLESIEFGLGSATLAAECDRLAGTIRSYLIPRALDPDTPMTVVVAGPTGSGKSTVVNSLSGAEVAPTGALRPTTRTPGVLASPDRASDYEVVGGVRCDVFAVEAPFLDHLVLVDAPDIDSTSTRHRAIAETLIDSADVVVFVTSALRYADEVPWQILRRAEARGAPVIHVLNRVGSASAGAIVDFRSRLSAAGMDEDVVMVPEHHLAEDARSVPSVAVQSLHKRLVEVAAGHRAFAGKVLGRVLSATLTQVIELIDAIAGVLDDIDLFETEISDSLARRSSDLSLVGTADGLYPALPTRSSRRALRRWKKRTGMAKPVESAESGVVERIVTAVSADIRRWLIEEKATLRAREIEPNAVIDGVMAAANTAARGWVEYVARIAVDLDERDVWLREAVLIDAAVRDELTQAARAMFGEDAPVVVDRARRELAGRLEVVYRLTARLVADLLRESCGEPDEADLRASVGAVTATLAPTHA